MESLINELNGDKNATLRAYLRLAEWNNALYKILNEYERINEVKNPYKGK